MENSRVKNKYKIAVIGRPELTLGFRLSGTPISYDAEEAEDAERAVKELMQNEDIGLVIIPTVLARKIKDKKIINIIESSISPIFVEIPEYGDERSADTLRKLIIRAIGIDIAGKK
jgi:vacuolar-type H+-ATPase subunit F/Vma7